MERPWASGTTCSGAFMGTLHVDVFDGSTWNNSVWSRSGVGGDVWQQATVDLTPYLAADLEVRFRGVTGSDPTNGWQGDMAVDDINITVSSGIRASVQVFLEGPYNAGAGSMNDDLRTAGLVPTVEPYSRIGYAHVGGGGRPPPGRVGGDREQCRGGLGGAGAPCDGRPLHRGGLTQCLAPARWRCGRYRRDLGRSFPGAGRQITTWRSGTGTTLDA